MNWDSTPVESFDDSPSSLGTYIRVNGSDVAINPGDNFVDTVKSVARDSNMGKFRLFLNGSEISPKDAPSVVEQGMALELRPYDVAG